MTDDARPNVRSPKRAEAWAKRALSRANTGLVGLLDAAFVNVKLYAALIGASILGNGVHDDAPGFQAVFNATGGASTGTTPWVPGPSVYVMHEPVGLSSTQQLRGSAGATLLSTNPNHGLFDAIFFGTTSPILHAGALTANIPAGAPPNTTLLNFAPAVGHWVILAHGTSQAAYQVKGVAGVVSPFTVTVDRPIVWPFVATDTATEVASIVQDVDLDGQGMKLAGTGLESIHFSAGWQLKVRNFHYVSTASNLVGSAFGFDVACRDVLFADCSTDCPNTSAGVYFQSVERGVCERFVSRNGGAAVVLFDDYQIGVEDSWSYNCTVGNDFQMTAITPGSSFGCIGCWITGCGSIDSAGNAFGASYSAGGLIANVLAQGPTGNGVELLQVTDMTIGPQIIVKNAGANGLDVDATCVRTTILELNVDGAASHALLVNAGAVGTIVGWLYATHCAAQAVDSGADLSIAHMRGTCDVADFNTFVVTTGGTFRLGDAQLKMLAANGTVVQQIGGTAYYDGLDFTIVGANGTGLYHNAGVAYVSNSKMSGPGSSFGIYVTAGATVRILGGVSLDGTGTPLTIAAGAYCNRTTIVAAGTGAAQATAFPDMKTTDKVETQLTVAAGVRAAGLPLVVQTAGVGWSSTFAATDTSTYSQVAL
jgi:hypothetical protein